MNDQSFKLFLHKISYYKLGYARITLNKFYHCKPISINTRVCKFLNRFTGLISIYFFEGRI